MFNLLSLIPVCLLAQNSPATKPLEYFLSGSQTDARVTTRPGYVLAGGGKSDDASFRWFLDHAGGGDIVVLRASGGDGYHSYLRGLGQVDSVESIVFHSRTDAEDPFVLSRVRQADGIFLAGGDQWNYVRFWKDTPVMAAINDAVRRGVPVGGTSAGLAVLGEFGFSAEHDTVTSAVALANPAHEKVTISRNFLKLPHLDCLITDSHFRRRDRMGRLLVFLARIRTESKCSEVKGVGVDEGAVVLLEADGSARVSGTGAAYFVKFSGTAYLVDKVRSGGTFHFGSWRGLAVERYELQIDNGQIKVSSGAQGTGAYGQPEEQ